MLSGHRLGSNLRGYLTWLPLKGISTVYIGKLSYTISAYNFHTKMVVNGGVIDIAMHKLHGGISSRIRNNIQKGFHPSMRGHGGLV
jgi:hypothetical protein